MSPVQGAAERRDTLGSLEFIGRADGGLAIESYASDGSALRLILRPEELQRVLEIIGEHLLNARAAGFARPLESGHGH